MPSRASWGNKLCQEKIAKTRLPRRVHADSTRGHLGSWVGGAESPKGMDSLSKGRTDFRGPVRSSLGGEGRG